MQARARTHTHTPGNYRSMEVIHNDARWFMGCQALCCTSFLSSLWGYGREKDERLKWRPWGEVEVYRELKHEPWISRSPFVWASSSSELSTLESNILGLPFIPSLLLLLQKKWFTMRTNPYQWLISLLWVDSVVGSARGGIKIWRQVQD